MDFNWIQQSVDLNNLLNWITTFNLLLNNSMNRIMMIYFWLNNLLNWIFVKPIWIEYWIESILGKIQTLNWINLGIGHGKRCWTRFESYHTSWAYTVSWRLPVGLAEPPIIIWHRCHYTLIFQQGTVQAQVLRGILR